MLVHPLKLTHRFQNLEGIKSSGPSSSGVEHIKLHNLEGQKFNTLQVIGVTYYLVMLLTYYITKLVTY
jgi:hypothetical protein